MRVVEYAVQPGQRDQWHTHPAKVSYVAEGGTLRVSTEDGQPFLADEKAGTATWAGAVGRHFVQNVGKTTVSIILTEVKGASSPQRQQARAPTGGTGSCVTIQPP